MNRAEKRRRQKLAKKSGQKPALAQPIGQIINTALQHHSAGRLNEAKAIYQAVLKTHPDEPGALHFLGLVAHQQNDEQTALEYLTRSIIAKPDYAEAHSNRGIVLKELDRLEEAITSYQKALSLKPDFADAHYNLGNAYGGLDRHKDAVKCYQKALTLNPEYTSALYNMGRSLGKLGKLDEAVIYFEKALALNPDYVIALTGFGSILKEQGDLEQAIAHYEKALSLAPDHIPAHDNLLLTEQYRLGNDHKTLFEMHRQWDVRHAQKYRPEWPVHGHDKTPDRRLRIGFVSPDLGRHPVGYFILPLLQGLPKEQIETVCYSARLPDDLTDKIKSATDIWRDTLKVNDDDLVQMIQSDDIDILIDLSGHSAGNRLLVFAQKPAPIQVTWAGYVATTGMTAIDYMITDRYSTLKNEEPFYQEKILRMPDGWLCYAPPQYAADVGPLPYDRTGAISFASFSNPIKINSVLAQVWTRILNATPSSTLLIKYKGINTATTEKRIRNLFEAEGLKPDRLILEGAAPHGELLARYGDVDIALDPFPYSGGLTTYEALWMGVPVITVPGQTFASRHSQSHLSTIGLPELVATDYEDYVRRAVALANDTTRLRNLRAGLRNQMAMSPACDGDLFAEGFAQLLRGIWQDWCHAESNTP